MSDSQEARRARRARDMAVATAPGANGLWSLDDIRARIDAGVDVPQGARFGWTNLRDFLNTGVGGGGSPVESQDLEQYLASTGMTPEQFQAQYGGLPLVFNGDGTVTYDPTAQRQAFEYTPASYARNAKIGIGGILALTGAGLAGLGGAGGAAGAELGGASLGAEELFAGMNSLVPGGSGVAEAAAAGIGAGATPYISPAIYETGSLSGSLLTNGAGEFLGPAAEAAGGTAATTAAQAGSSALSKILNGTANADDWLKVGGTVASGLLGAYSSGKTADAIKGEASRLDGIQAPWRGRLSDMYANPAGFLESAPVKASIDQGTKAVSRALSTQYGNTAMSPNALAEINKYAANSLYDKWGQEASRLAAFGGLNFPATASSTLNVQGADADGGVLDSAQYVLGQLTAPKPAMTVADFMRALNGGNVFGTKTVGV